MPEKIHRCNHTENPPNEVPNGLKGQAKNPQDRAVRGEGRNNPLERNKTRNSDYR